MARNDDWDKDPQAREWLRRVRRELGPKILQSAVVMSLVPRDNKPDPKFAVELGYAIMLDKPIIAAVAPGQKIPDHLARVADEIVEVDMDRPETTAQRLQEAMERLLGKPEE